MKNLHQKKKLQARSEKRGSNKNGEHEMQEQQERKSGSRGRKGAEESGSVKSYCTKYMFGAHYGKHIRSCAHCGNCRKFLVTGEVLLRQTQT